MRSVTGMRTSFSPLGVMMISPAYSPGCMADVSNVTRIVPGMASPEAATRIHGCVARTK